MQESTSLWNSRAFGVVDGRGKIVKEAKVASEPEALVYFFKELGFPVNRIGFELASGNTIPGIVGVVKWNGSFKKRTSTME